MTTTLQRTVPRSIYRDIGITFEPHPNTGDLSVTEDVASVMRSVRNLVLTERGGRRLRPNLFTNIRKLLFENITPKTGMMLADYIRQVITSYEPRAQLTKLDVIPNYDSPGYSVVVEFTVLYIEQTARLTMFLKRTR